MTEQEKRRRRREMERRMRARQNFRGREGQERSGTLAFRTYVTAVLVGGCLLISLFESKTSDMVCNKLKETIACLFFGRSMKGMKGSTVPIRKNRPSLLVWKGLAWERKTEDWLAPVSGVVTSDCGKRENPLLHKQELHDGLDIAVPQGSEVVAVKSGRVSEVRTSATYGKLLQFETTDGYTILYAHLSEILVKKGEKIKQGQVVAKSGNTGLSTGPHLHYGIYRDGKLLNPMEYLPEGATEKV